MTDIICVSTPNDVLTRAGARTIVSFCCERVQLAFDDALDLVDEPARVVSRSDVVQYAIDALNEDAPIGHWYILTADSNLIMQTEDT